MTENVHATIKFTKTKKNSRKNTFSRKPHATQEPKLTTSKNKDATQGDFAVKQGEKAVRI